MLNIRPLEFKDCATVAAAHAAHLATPFDTDGGIHLLQYHYESVIRQQGEICFVATVDNNFAGFICGVWNHKAVNKIPFIKIPLFMLDMFKHLIARPQRITNNLRGLLMRPITARVAPQGYELRPIVVLPEFRGKEVARELVERLLQDAKARGYEQVYLFTASDNIAAIKFYLKCGFILANQELTDKNQPESGKLFRYYFPQEKPDALVSTITS